MRKFLSDVLINCDLTVSGSTSLGAATGVTVDSSDNSTKLATTAFVKAQGFVKTDTTYLLSVPANTTNITLQGTDSSTDEVTISAAGASSISRVSASELRITSSDTIDYISNVAFANDVITFTGVGNGFSGTINLSTYLTQAEGDARYLTSYSETDTLDTVTSRDGVTTNTIGVGTINVIGTTAGQELLTVDGTNGRLFTVTDDLSDSLFSVNTIAGLPVIEVFADNTIKLGNFANPIEIDSSANIIIPGTITASGYNDANWNTAYNDRITSAAVSGTSTKTLTLTQGDGSTITTSWTDIEGSGADGYVSDVALNGNSLDFTAVGSGFAGSIDLSGITTDLTGYATEQYVLDNSDDYGSWNLKTNNVQRTTVQSGGTLDIVAGSNVSVAYGAGGVVTISSTDTNTDTNNYVTGLSFNTSNGILTATRQGLADLTVDLDGRYLTSFTETLTELSLASNILSYRDETGTVTELDLSLYLDDTNLARLTSGTLDSNTGIATFSRDDDSTFTVDFSALFDDVDNYVDSVAFSTTTGILTIGRTGSLANLTVDLDGRYDLAGTAATEAGAVNTRIDEEVLPLIQTPAITSNGSTPSLNSGISAAEVRTLIGAGTSSTDTNYYLSGASFNTGNGVLTLTVSGATDQTVDLDGRYLTSFTESDPVFSASPAGGISAQQIVNWDEAHGWGNHADGGYLTSVPAEYVTATEITNYSINPRFGSTIGMGNDSAVIEFQDSNAYTKAGYWSTLDAVLINGDGNSNNNIILRTGNILVNQNQFISGKLGVQGVIELGDNAGTTIYMGAGDGNPTPVVIETFAAAKNIGAFLDFTIYDEGKGNMRSGTLQLVFNADQVMFNEVNTMDIGDTTPCTLDAVNNAGTIDVRFTTPDPTFHIKYHVRTL